MRSGHTLILSCVVFVAVLPVLDWVVQKSIGFPRFFVVGSDNCLERDDSLGLKFRANCRAGWTDDLLTGNVVTSFATNALGLRDSEVVDDGVPRILALGDSCTWGWQVEQEQAYPQVLERLLTDRFGAHAYRVINAGAPGYTSRQGLSYLREHGLPLHPAIVLIAFGYNDGQPTGEIEAALAGQRRLRPLIETDDFLLAHSAIWRWMRALTQAKPRYDLPLRVAPDQYRRNVEAMITESRAAGATPVLISFAGDPNNDAYARVLPEIARALGVPFIDYQGPRIDIVHPDARGYEVLARQIFGVLERESLLPSPRGAA